MLLPLLRVSTLLNPGLTIQSQCLMPIQSQSNLVTWVLKPTWLRAKVKPLWHFLVRIKMAKF